MLGGKKFVADLAAESPRFVLSHSMLKKDVALLEASTTIQTFVVSIPVQLLKIMGGGDLNHRLVRSNSRAV